VDRLIVEGNMKRLAVALLCGMLLGCASSATPSSSPTPLFPAVLTIDSRGGPPVIIEIGALEATRVACSAGASVTLGQAGVPQLPWDLRVVRQNDGRVLLSTTVTELPHWVLLIGDSVLMAATPAAGPSGPPCSPTPAPASTSTPSVSPTQATTDTTSPTQVPPLPSSAIHPAVPCTRLDTAVRIPPRVTLAAGTTRDTGLVASYTWNGRVAQAREPLPTATVEMNSGATIEVRIAGDACAFGWYVAYGPVPRPSNGPMDMSVTGLLLPTVINPGHSATIRQNRFVFPAPPVGPWLIQSTFDFGSPGYEGVMWQVVVR
jgi:hypothetical protein